jgi:ubiquinone biosynthesis monooxygenase Coq7
MRKKIQEMIRVNHAGEYGAVRIYHGQLKSFAKKDMFDILPEIEYMKQQEINHLKYFNKKLVEEEVLSTVFLPFWHVIGYGLGYISAKLGDDFAMTCTESVEEVIDKHYQDQIQYLNDNVCNKSWDSNCKNEEETSKNAELMEKIEQFRQEEVEHKDHAIKYNLSLYQKPLRKGLNKIFGCAVKIGCKIAIGISKKI